MNKANEVLGEKVLFAVSGNFISDSLKSIVAGVEISDKKQFGIQFYLIEWIDDEFQKTYSTGLIDGSFDQCTVNKIKFTDFKNELIYFNSDSYYMGSSGGEVFAYIIDFKGKNTFSAHLTVASGGMIVLELSDNIKNRRMQEFFTGYFKRDYPNLSVIQSETSI